MCYPSWTGALFIVGMHSAVLGFQLPSQGPHQPVRQPVLVRCRTSIIPRVRDCPRNGPGRPRPASELSAWFNKGKDDAAEKANTTSGNSNPILSFLTSATERLQSPLNIPAPNWKVVGSYAGGLLSGVALSVVIFFTPYTSLGEGLQKSLELFENVLVDLEQGYVEEVDVQKLFTTGVNAMLSSLDPYTEFENIEQAQDMKMSVQGRYGGVGLVIAGDRGTEASKDQDAPLSSSAPALKRGVTVVSAFEGYAYDAGLRVGDRIVAVDGRPVIGVPVDKVRDMLRGEPATRVHISYTRDAPGWGDRKEEVYMTRRLVRLRDVRLATLVGPPKDGIGYIQLTGFSQGAGKEVANAYRALQEQAPGGLKGLLFDLRGNPGGLLESAVDVSALLIPEGSDIVSAKGRKFGSVLYRSSQAPIRNLGIPLVVLINGGTASAAEIVSGAVQDLDAGVIVGSGKGRTFGKGLVQNIATLPYDNALKLTVAKYYTPSGRCIQSQTYKGGGRVMVNPPLEADATAPTSSQGAGVGVQQDMGYQATAVAETDRKEFFTKHGRTVRDGGGIEADVKVKFPPPSALEIALQAQGAYFDFAGQWASTHELPANIDGLVDETMLQDFKRYVLERQNRGSYKLDLLYGSQIKALEDALRETQLPDSERQLKPFRNSIIEEMSKDFSKRGRDIQDSLADAILARYLPESMVLKRQLDRDPQFLAAVAIAQDPKEYSKLLNGYDFAFNQKTMESIQQALTDALNSGTLGGVSLKEGPVYKDALNKVR